MRSPVPASLTGRSYVWGDDWEKAKTMCESFDYIFQLAVEMAKLGIPWTKQDKP